MEIFEIGDIVAIKTHHYFDDQGGVFDPTLAGEPNHVPPLMVVGEILIHKKGSFDPIDGEEIHEKGSKSCKCFWFNHDKHQFEESWFEEKQLKIIEKSEPTKSGTIINYNVIFKTAKLEVGKRKLSLSFRNESPTRSENHINSFVPPVMLVMSVKSSDNRDVKFDLETGKASREISSRLVKCKWFNPIGQKYSEKVLPVELLQVLPIYSNDFVKWINQSKIDKLTYLFEIESSNYPVLLRVSTVFFLNGWYYFQGFDFVKNQPKSLIIDPEKGILTPIEYKEDSWPKFEPDQKLIPVEDFIEMNKSRFLRIEYVGRIGERTVRTVTDFGITEYDHSTGLVPEEKIIKYLEGKCLLRNADRRFRLDRIHSIEVLNISKD